jgi:DeoR family transcriptional regulator, glycerol-3-phosphate regulon repressor
MVWHAMDVLQKPSKSERQTRILGELRASASIRISELAAKLGVSGETIRRDLLEMGETGLLSRTYGGAVARPFGFEPAWNERLNEMAEERRRIAALAADLIRPGDALMIDSGSTVLHFAQRIAADLKDLTVITHSFSVAMAAGGNPSFTVIACPGTYDPHEGNVTGAETVDFLERYNVNWAIVGASGITADGPNEARAGGAAVKRAMLSRAEQNVLLIDHSKFGRMNLEVICPLRQIGRIVTDRPATGSLRKALHSAGTEVAVAQS